MSQQIIFPPEKDESSAQQENRTVRKRRSQYYQRRRLSGRLALIGLIAGILIGVLFTWYIAPQQKQDSTPGELSAANKAWYAVAIILNYSNENNLEEALQQLFALGLGNDPIESVADFACDLARSEYVDNASGRDAVREMMSFYQLQGRSSCADELIEPANEQPETVDLSPATSTPVASPLPSKTPLPPQATAVAAIPEVTAAPEETTSEDIEERFFEGRVYATYCEVENSGLIEVYVKTFTGAGVPGEKVRVRWEGGSDVFYSGLKPDLGDAYADFQMEEGMEYIIDMPELSESVSTVMKADPCITLDGQNEAITSYQVQFSQLR